MDIRFSNLCGSQYGEESILFPFFEGCDTGYLVDVGAADGRVNSNSVQLLKRLGWKGLLIEPEPTNFISLSQYYRDNERVSCEMSAIGTNPGKHTFYCNGQVSTLDRAWKKQCAERFKLHYTLVTVEVKTLTDVLDFYGVPEEIDFLSIDCEGRDKDVVKSLDFTKYRPRLICIEGKRHRIDGYTKLAETRGNMFFQRSE